MFPLNNFVTASLKNYSLKELRVFTDLKINFKEEHAVEKNHILESKIKLSGHKNMKKILDLLLKQFNYLLFSVYKIQNLIIQMTYNEVLWD